MVLFWDLDFLVVEDLLDLAPLVEHYLRLGGFKQRPFVAIHSSFIIVDDKVSNFCFRKQLFQVSLGPVAEKDMMAQLPLFIHQFIETVEFVRRR